MSFKNSIVSFPAPFLSVVSPQAVCSFDAMHKGKLPQFKRHKAFGQYKNRTAGGTYLASPLRRSVHKFPVVLLLLIWGIKIPPNHYRLVVYLVSFETLYYLCISLHLFSLYVIPQLEYHLDMRRSAYPACNLNMINSMEF